MRNLIFAFALLTLQMAVAADKSPQSLRTLGQLQAMLDAKEGSYEFSAVDSDPFGLCEKQVASLEWIQTDQKIALVIGPHLSFGDLEVESAQEKNDSGCLSISKSKIEKHKLTQTIQNVCSGQAKATQNFTNTHSLEFSNDHVVYVFQHQVPSQKLVTTTCRMKFLRPKGSRK